MPSALNERFFFAREACPVCSSTAISELYRCPLTCDPVKGLISSHYEAQGRVDWSLLDGTDYVVCECRECGLIYQRNVPNAYLLDRIYNEMIAPQFLMRLEDERLTIDNFNRIAGEMDVLFRLCGKSPSKMTFLDYGFGHGRWARVARALGAKVFATEIGEDKKSSASAIGVEIIADEDVDGMRFDIVHTEQVFEHLVAPARDFRRLAAATGELFKIAVPRRGNLRRLLTTKGMISKSPFSEMLQGRQLGRSTNNYSAIGPLEHLNAYGLRAIERLAADNEMRVVSCCRRGSVALNLTSPKLLAKSFLRAAAMLAGSAIVRDTGYYLLAPRVRKTEQRA